jgi:hypothetical protein
MKSRFEIFPVLILNILPVVSKAIKNYIAAALNEVESALTFHEHQQRRLQEARVHELQLKERIGKK